MNSKKKPKNKIFRLKFLVYDVIKWTGALSALIVLRPKIVFENKAAKKTLKGPAVLIANHESFLDPIKLHFAFWYRRMHLVATSELFDSKFKNWFFNSVLCIKVNKEHFNFQTFRDVSNELTNGSVVGIFPEGGLKENSEGNVSPFKAGAVLMALKNNAPVIPIYLNKPKKWYNRQLIVIGEPVKLNNSEGQLPLSEVENIAKSLREKELNLIKLIKGEKGYVQTIHR